MRSNLGYFNFYGNTRGLSCKGTTKTSDKGAYEQTYRLIVSDYLRPRTPATPKASQVRCRSLGDGGRGFGVWASGTPFTR